MSRYLYRVVVKWPDWKPGDGHPVREVAHFTSERAANKWIRVWKGYNVFVTRYRRDPPMARPEWRCAVRDDVGRRCGLAAGHRGDHGP